MSDINDNTNKKENTKQLSCFDAASDERNESSLSPHIKGAYCRILEVCDDDCVVNLTTQPISGIGENSYGSVLRVTLHSTETSENEATIPQHSIVKISPKDQARRNHMHVVDYYTREIFMYGHVFNAFRELSANAPTGAKPFDITPAMIASSLLRMDEFIIFEDLTQSGYLQNSRNCMPNYDLVACALKALAQLHSMSFVLQARNHSKFCALVSRLYDNLFTEDIEEITVEFGKNSLRRTRQLLYEEKELVPAVADLIDVLQRTENHFKTLSLSCVMGTKVAPYAVICHGDFWNNNILYRYDSDKAIEAKLIDFQMSRYAPPVLDLVHYLFVCTEKQLRDAHFHEFLDIYFTALTQSVASYDLDIEMLYPRHIFEQQLRNFGIYGLIMAALSMPFFVSDASEIVDLDEVCKAIQDLPPNESKKNSVDISNKQTMVNCTEVKCRELIDEFDMLTERTLPIFKRRMCDTVRDLIKYDMVKPLLNL